MCATPNHGSADIYCLTCSRLCCNLCYFKEHKNHEIQHVNLLSAWVKEQLSQILDDAKLRLPFLTSEKQRIDQAKARIEQQEQQHTAELDDIFAKLKEAFTKVEQESKQQLKQKYASMKKRIETEEDKFKEFVLGIEKGDEFIAMMQKEPIAVQMSWFNMAKLRFKVLSQIFFAFFFYKFFHFSYFFAIVFSS